MKRKPEKYNKFKLKYCVACGHSGSFYPLDIDHVITFKSHPELANDPRNCLTLCRACHTSKGQKGLSYIVDNSATVKRWLLSHGWYFDEFLKKWRLDKIE